MKWMVLVVARHEPAVSLQLHHGLTELFSRTSRQIKQIQSYPPGSVLTTPAPRGVLNLLQNSCAFNGPAGEHKTKCAATKVSNLVSPS